jgi:hypothetical protein
MKNIYILVFALLTTFTVNAQTEKKINTTKAYSKDFVMLQFGYNNWLNAPDSIKIGGFSRFANVYLCYDFPIQKSNFSFAAGAGVGSSHIFLNKQKAVLNDTPSSIRFVADTFKKNKIAMTYVEAPFEIRYFSDKENRNKGIKAALGLRVGALLNSHWKGKYKFNNKPIVEKVSTKRFIETYRVAVTARVGYGNFSVIGTYSLNNLFRVNNGPAGVTTYSIGLCLSGL